VQKSFRNGKDVADFIRKMDRINMTSKIPEGGSQEQQILMTGLQNRKDMTSCTKQR
jgi:hypothetical protein